MNLRKTALALLAVPVAAAVLVPASASAAPARHRPDVVVHVWFRHHGRTEIVNVVRDVHHAPVTAAGSCLSTGYYGSFGKPVSKKNERSRLSCPHGDWVSVGWAKWHGWHARYHRVRGSKNLYGD